MTYTGPRPALHAALTELAHQLDPATGRATYVPGPPDRPFDGHYLNDGETPSASVARRVHAVIHFRDGLRVLAVAGDSEARSIMADMSAAAERRGDPFASAATSSYSTIAAAALARLNADAYQLQAGDDTAWCDECRRYRLVTERSVEGHLTARGEVGYNVAHLQCGHARQDAPVLVAAAPGGESVVEDQAAHATRARTAEL